MAFYDWLLFASPGDPAALGHPLLTAFAQRDGTLPGAQDSEATAALALRCLRDFQQYQKSGAERLVGTYSI
ncbi:MAG: hypothetical protein PSV23_00620 [Brevundimonas sp.]|uniref:hypothetical protein n=1 Tax=Brevundimonas sp. TaxID=1871086 RepID=UPI002487C348|nr:hypothetical protein [Brevundimonas sp.]MDI1325286.1 hypothetical protein [Brevundimonas sp.]